MARFHLRIPAIIGEQIMTSQFVGNSLEHPEAASKSNVRAEVWELGAHVGPPLGEREVYD